MIKYKKNKQDTEKNNKQIQNETLLQEETPERSLTEKLRERKKLQRKKTTKRISWAAFAVFFIAFLYWGFMPYQGTVPYALCKILIELKIPYPETLKFTEVAELRSGDIRIWFTHTDAFGGFRQEPFLCSFGQDPETGKSIISRARWGNIELEQKQIDAFNQIMPFLVKEGYYDTTYPAALPDSIAEMNLNIDSARKVNIMDLVKGKR